MTIRVKFFAKLREDLGKEEVEVAAHEPMRISEVWTQATGRALPAEIFCSINHEHAQPDQLANDRDEVAFFPRITGG